MPGKKSKKIKGKTLGLTEFLSDGGSNAGQKVVTRKSAWADDVENEEEYDTGRKEKVILPTAPRATRSPDVDDEKVPKFPPYQAYISNLAYEVEENDIYDFFKNLQVKEVRLPRDERKPKGYGYVEFGNRNSLISALSMVDTSLKSRRMRIEVADNNDGDRRGRGNRDRGGDMNRDRNDGPDRTMGDWRSRPKEDPMPEPESDRGGFGRDRDGGYDRRGTGRRDFGSAGFRDGDRFRDGFGDRDRGFDNRDNYGDRGRFGDREGYGDRDRFASRRGGDRDRDFGGSRSGFGPRRYGQGSDFEREGGFRRDDGPPAEPKQRQKLALKPRSTPEEPAAPAPVAAQASIFGGAKPVDTAAREKEIEERLEKEKDKDISRLPPKEPRNDDNRSKSGSEYGDRDDDVPSEKPPSTPRRMEPAPPPKENAWTRRSQQSQGPRSDPDKMVSVIHQILRLSVEEFYCIVVLSCVEQYVMNPDLQDKHEGNGRISPHSDRSDHEQERSRRESPRRYQAPRPESPRRYRDSGDLDRRPQNARGTPRKQYERDDRGLSRGQPARGGGGGKR
ncbi:Eukaryotic translation initiation factor 4B [Blattella germanica]|nr:Eukaryotic translation initiation factor 4B [Blattella germanica]